MPKCPLGRAREDGRIDLTRHHYSLRIWTGSIQFVAKLCASNTEVLPLHTYRGGVTFAQAFAQADRVVCPIRVWPGVWRGFGS